MEYSYDLYYFNYYLDVIECVPPNENGKWGILIMNEWMLENVQHCLTLCVGCHYLPYTPTHVRKQTSIVVPSFSGIIIIFNWFSSTTASRKLCQGALSLPPCTAVTLPSSVWLYHRLIDFKFVYLLLVTIQYLNNSLVDSYYFMTYSFY